MKPARAHYTIPKVGERALIVGQTGSGKTAFAHDLIRRHEQTPIIIYDAKGEPKFNSLPNSTIVDNMEAATQAIEQPRVNERGEDKFFDYIIFRPDLDTSSDPGALDDLLFHHYKYLDHVGCYIDELYAFHKNGRHGKGLNAILTRGRSKGISCIMSTQRPAWISLFCLTEAQHLYLFSLSHTADRKRIDEIHEGFSSFEPPQLFEFWEIPVKPHSKAVKRKPIDIDKIPNSQYVDNALGLNTPEIKLEGYEGNPLKWI